MGCRHTPGLVTTYRLFPFGSGQFYVNCRDLPFACGQLARPSKSHLNIQPKSSDRKILPRVIYPFVEIYITGVGEEIDVKVFDVVKGDNTKNLRGEDVQYWLNGGEQCSVMG